MSWTSNNVVGASDVSAVSVDAVSVDAVNTVILRELPAYLGSAGTPCRCKAVECVGLYMCDFRYDVAIEVFYMNRGVTGLKYST